MHNQRDLLPWIFGGLVMLSTLSVAAYAVLRPAHPAAVAMTPGVATPGVTTPGVIAPTAPPATPIAAAAPVALPPPSPPSPPVVAAATAAAGAPAAAPTNQIWECDVDGRKIFADSPCGAHASLRELGAVNGMAPVRVAAAYNPASGYPGAGAYPVPTDTAADSLETQPGNVYYFSGVGRRAHPDRQHPHARGLHGIRR